MTEIPTLSLNDGRRLPQLGLGVWQVPDAQAAALVGAAVGAGYRLIDTATLYGNERGVGDGVRSAALPRDGLFVTTKLWHDAHAYDTALRAFDDSLARLGLDHVDLYLIHWPAPRLDRYVQAWKALLRLREEGRARSVGVSNFTVEQLARLIDRTGEAPAVNQIELHPRFQQTALRAFHAERGIVTQAWSPLGQGGLLADPAVVETARKHGRTPAQTVLRWHLELGHAVIPKTARAERLAENADVFDFRLDADDMARLAALDRADGRLGPDPARFG